MYSRSFLRSAGIVTGDIPLLRGTVTGDNKRPNTPTIKGVVLCSNLVLADRLHLEAP